MTIFNSIILGIIQGLAEFLPISSSGHLIIARDLLGWHGSSDLSFDAILQLATGIALVVYFRKDIWRLVKTFFAMIFQKVVEQKDKVMIWAIIIGTIPAVIFGLLLQKYMETTFRSAILVALVLLIGSAVMYFAEKFSKKNKTNCVSYPHLKDNEVLDTQYHGCFFGIGIVHRLFRTQRVSGTSQLNCRGIQTPLSNKQLSIWNGIGIGFFQCLALVPGFSRSGATISGGLFFGLNREDSARFSFLLSIPIILGSGLEQLLSILKSGGFYHDWVNILSGSATAFIVGILAIGFLMKFLKKYSLNVFIWYRIVLAIIVLTILS